MENLSLSNSMKKCGGEKRMLSTETKALFFFAKVIVMIICLLSNNQRTVFTQGKEVLIEKNHVYRLEAGDRALLSCANNSEISFLTYKNNPQGEDSDAQIKINKSTMTAVECNKDFATHIKNYAQKHFDKNQRYALLFKPFDCENSGSGIEKKAEVYCAINSPHKRRRRFKNDKILNELSDAQFDDEKALDDSLADDDEISNYNNNVAKQRHVKNVSGNNKSISPSSSFVEEKQTENVANTTRAQAKKKVIIEGSGTTGFNKTVTTREPNSQSVTQFIPPTTNGTFVISALQKNCTK